MGGQDLSGVAETLLITLYFEKAGVLRLSEEEMADLAERIRRHLV